MPTILQHTFGRAFAPPPMPAEAFPPGLIGKAPAAQALMEQAWRSMFFTTLVQGMVFGGILVLAVIVAVIVRLNLKSAIQGAIADAVRQQ